MGADNVGAKARATASSAYAYGRDTVDRVVDPAVRQEYYHRTTTFATTRPIVTSFILFNLIFSFIPVVFFFSFVVSTFCLALVSALCFTFFWAGVGLCFLVPVLFFTIGVGVLAWLWALAAFFVSRYIYSLVNPHAAEPSTNGVAADDKVVIFPRSDSANRADYVDRIKTEASDFKQ
ncbi:hypothetical protein Micbo1qcDRAFT_193985 [Microdochium bolleyi]|uniref:Uncharacterized protein n=1 Tax=Microdochium bolleyi TaxID=196109 RepID=A0A136J5T8_9PEZI|nr:hypothetical protein Micbo1qcDRAFT_193985 [Microdochium bolleyi]